MSKDTDENLPTDAASGTDGAADAPAPRVRRPRKPKVAPDAVAEAHDGTAAVDVADEAPRPRVRKPRASPAKAVKDTPAEQDDAAGSRPRVRRRITASATPEAPETAASESPAPTVTSAAGAVASARTADADGADDYDAAAGVGAPVVPDKDRAPRQSKRRAPREVPPGEEDWDREEPNDNRGNRLPPGMKHMIDPEEEIEGYFDVDYVEDETYGDVVNVNNRFPSDTNLINPDQFNTGRRRRQGGAPRGTARRTAGGGRNPGQGAGQGRRRQGGGANRNAQGGAQAGGGTNAPAGNRPRRGGRNRNNNAGGGDGAQAGQAQGGAEGGAPRRNNRSRRNRQNRGGGGGGAGGGQDSGGGDS